MYCFSKFAVIILYLPENIEGLELRFQVLFSWPDGALSFHPSVHRKELKYMDIEKMQAALSYLKKKKPELTVQQYRTIKGQIICGAALPL